MNLYEYAQSTEEEQEEQTAPVKNPLAKEQEEQRAATDQAKEVYRCHQENIKKAGALEAEILTGLKKGEPITSLFLKAAEAISLMNGNREFLQQVKADVTTIYGKALGEPGAVKTTRAEVQRRLERLEQAERIIADERERGNIQAAIRAHRLELESLTT